eukprot:40958_1
MIRTILLLIIAINLIHQPLFGSHQSLKLQKCNTGDIVQQEQLSNLHKTAGNAWKEIALQSQEKDNKMSKKDNILFSLCTEEEYQKMMASAKEQTMQLIHRKKELIENKNVIDLMFHIEKYFCSESSVDSKQKGKVQLKEKEFNELINIIGKAKLVEELKLSTGKGSHAKLFINGKLYVISSQMLCVHVKSLIEQIKHIIVSKFNGKSFETIVNHSHTKKISLKQLQIENDALKLLLSKFKLMQIEQKQLQNDLKEIDQKILASYQETFHTLNEIERIQIENKFRFKDIFEQEQMVKRYFALKNKLKTKLDHENAKEYKLLKPKIWEMAMDYYRTEYFQKYSQIKRASFAVERHLMGTNIDDYIFREDNTTLVETIRYKKDCVKYADNANMVMKIEFVEKQFEWLFKHFLDSQKYSDHLIMEWTDGQRKWKVRHGIIEAHRYVNVRYRLYLIWHTKKDEIIKLIEGELSET